MPGSNSEQESCFLSGIFAGLDPQGAILEVPEAKYSGLEQVR